MILIIGKTGQLARALLSTVPADETVIALGREDYDLSDPAEAALCIRAHQPRLVINAAAYTAVDRAESERDLAFQINRNAPAAMAKQARDIGARFVSISTDFVFDGRASRPYVVSAPVAPLGVYGASKAEGEAAVLAADPSALIVRTAWVYNAEGRNFVTSMLRLLRERESLNVVADQVGTPTAAITLAAAIWALTEAGASAIHHFTDAGLASWYDFAVAIQEIGLAAGLLDREIEIHPIATADYPTAAERPAFSVLDKSSTWPLLLARPRHWRHVLEEVLFEARA